MPLATDGAVPHRAALRRNDRLARSRRRIGFPRIADAIGPSNQRESEREIAGLVERDEELTDALKEHIRRSLRT